MKGLVLFGGQKKVAYHVLGHATVLSRREIKGYYSCSSWWLLFVSFLTLYDCYY